MTHTAPVNLPTGQNFALLPVEQLEGLFRSIVREEVKAIQQEDLQEKLLSPKEVTKLFHPAISIATLDNWAEKGYVKKHYIGKLTYYKYSEVIGAAKELKRYARTNPSL